MSFGVRVQSMGHLCERLDPNMACMEPLPFAEEWLGREDCRRAVDKGRRGISVQLEAVTILYCINSRKIFCCCQAFSAGAPNHF